ncbi:MAG: cyclase family protein [Actinomycetota bacterium]
MQNPPNEGGAVTDGYPRYDELRLIDALGGRVSWGVFGSDDEVGALNFSTPERRVAAAAEVQRGVHFNLSLPLDEPEPAKTVNRSRYRHLVFSPERNVQDDVIDNFYPQGSSQLDGLRHVEAREFGFYNGISEHDAGPLGTRLGVDRWADHGIFSRGVLVDLAKHWEAQGIEIGFEGGPVAGPELVDEVLDAQGVQVQEGDTLLIRTGYMAAYYAISREERRELPRKWAGLSALEPMAAWLWDHRVSLIGADNPAVEARPGDPGYLHRRAIPMLGLGLGEMLVLDDLAADCARDGRYSFLFAAVPLNLPGGVGTPANAFAMK